MTTAPPTAALTATAAARLEVDVLVLPVAQGPAGPVLVHEAGLPEELRAAATSAALGVTGEADEVRRIPTAGAVQAPVLATVGIGAHDPAADGDLEPERLRRAAGAAARQLTGLGSLGFAFPADDDDRLAAVVEGALLGAYAFDRYRALPDAKRPAARVEVVTALAKGGRGAKGAKGAKGKESPARQVVARAEVVARAVHAVRDLVNSAPADLYPGAFADLARAAAKGTKVKVTVLDEKQLAAGGYGGLVAVGMGSARPPRLVRVGWAPPRAKRHVALVGKGITFDSGGLSIKPAKSMETMKSDMAGAAAVLHTVLAAAALELPVAVTGWLCLAENMPSGTAQRPSDVITQRGGKTVEVLNTDAEGRLVLADGLVAAGEEHPDAILDIATLTGAQIVALGHRVSAVMGTGGLPDVVVDAARASGEQFWPMPLPEELRASLKSKVADLANIGDRMGGMLSAGIFLREFVGDVPWAHLDIAGPSFNEHEAWGYTPAGGTGVGVRTLLAVLEAQPAR